MYCTRFCPVLRRANYPLPRSFRPRLMLHFVLFLYDALKVALFCDIYKKFVHFHTLPLFLLGLLDVYAAFYFIATWRSVPR